MHPLAPDYLYSAAGDGFMHPGYGFAESHAGGDTWFRSGEGLQHHYLWGIAANPVDPSTLVISAASAPQTAHAPAQAESTLYRRSGNRPWQRISVGLPPARGMLASVLATHRLEGGIFYAANNQGIFRSSDAGITWEQLPIRWLADSRIGPIVSLVVSQE